MRRRAGKPVKGDLLIIKGLYEQCAPRSGFTNTWRRLKEYNYW